MRIRLNDRLECNGIEWKVVEFERKQLDSQIEIPCVKLMDKTWHWQRWFTVDEAKVMFDPVKGY